MRGPVGAWRWPLLAGITAVAFALRVPGLDQSLAGDEIFTYDIVTGHGLFDVLREVHATSVTPPLHYVLAWLAVQVGEPETWIRVPSLLLGTAAVPLIYALGRRTVGERAGLVGAALFALSPFAVWYADEARAYATLTFFVAASTYGLVRALEPGERRLRWWALFAGSALAVMYSHYTGVFVLLAQVGWAAWTLRAEGARLRPLVLACAAVVAGYLPWIPFYLDQRRNPGILAIDALFPLTASSAWQNPVIIVFGQPFAPWDALLGTAGFALCGVAAAAVLAAVARGPREWGAGAGRGLALVAVLSVATPAGLALYAATGDSLYAPRNLSASLPALCLLLGWLASRPPRALAFVASGALLAAVAVATVAGFDEDRRRPPYRDVAEAIDRSAGPRDAVLLLKPFADFFGRDQALRTLTINFDRPHDFAVSRTQTDAAGVRDALDRAARRPRLLLVQPQTFGVPGEPRPPALGPRFRLVSRRVFPALAPVGLFVYRVEP